MGGLGKRSYYLCIVACLVLNPISVKAETTADLYNALGVEQNTALEVKSSEISDSEEYYNTCLSEYNYACNYNEVLSSLNVKGLSKELKSLKEEREDIVKQIQDEGFYLSYDEITELYDKYDILNTQIKDLRNTLKNYKSRKRKKVPAYDFTAMNDSIENLKLELENIKVDTEIGDVSNVTNFMQTTYCLKRKFDGTGVTLKALPNTGVLSPFTGTVSYSDRTEEEGEKIVITLLDNINITFNNVKARYVQTGDVVQQYQKIATTNDDLYITLEINGVYYDMDKLFGGKNYE